ncbi:terminase large subunit domain-containing protein [Rubritalea spongiae]|uniref:Terminase large subunit domain-containing protein n=1 Tax=Rubritalea spongiae TaxID=430797 RepID=A0ABW5E2F3_9BACT
MKTPLELLLPYQGSWVADNARFKAGIWSRQVGKDFSSNAEIVVDCMSNPKTTWMIAAPSERQAVESLGKSREWSEAFQFAIENEVEERAFEGALLKSAEIHYPNGSRIIAVPGKPDTVRGFSANILLTEFAFFEDPDATWKAILPSITNPLRGGEKKARLISTPNGKGGRGKRFYEIVRDNLLEPKQGRKTKWSVHKVTIEDAVRYGLPVDIDELRDGIDDPIAWAQEFECEFIDSSNVLLPYDLIETAESFEATESRDSSWWDMAGRAGGEIFLGIDFGRISDPTVCWTLEKVGDVLWTREVLVLKGMSTVDQFALLTSRFKACRKAVLDYTGGGIGLGDLAVDSFGEWKPQDHKLNGKVELANFTANLKAEIFPRLRRAFEAPCSVRIPVSVPIREDLHAMEQVVRGGSYSYVAPRTAEGHSDRCTALALAVRAADCPSAIVMPRAAGARRRMGRNSNRGLVG